MGRGRKEMTKKQVKEKILYYIKESQGIKGTGLIAELFNRAHNEKEIKAIADANVPELLETLVTEEKIVEVEYRLSSMPYRAKSFYLPKGTVVKVYQ